MIWLLPHGVDLLENLDIRIQQLEANDYSQSLSHIQHVEERLIILEENTKLEHHNEKIHHRLVNLETNYENSAGPEIIQNLFERLDVIENSPAQINSDVLTNVTKRLTELENKSAESFVENKLKYFEKPDSVQDNLQTTPYAPNPAVKTAPYAPNPTVQTAPYAPNPAVQNVVQMWQDKSAPPQSLKYLVKTKQIGDRYGDRSEIFEDNLDPRVRCDRYVESRKNKSFRGRRGRSPYRTPHCDHHQQFEDDFDPRRDVGHEFDRAPSMYEEGKFDSYDKHDVGEDPHDVSLYRRPPPYNGRQRTVQSDTGENNPRGRGPPSPKMPTFNGNSTDDWVAYHVQFERIAKTYGWDIETKLEKLIESLRGKAASYFGRLPELDRENYEILTTALLDRYDRKDPPSTLRIQLQSIKQTVDEDLEAFAERVQQLAHDAYPQATVQMVKDASIDAFLRGCKEKAASLAAMNRTPDSLSEAISAVKSCFHNQKAVYGESGKVRQVTFENPITKDPSPASLNKSDSNLINDQLAVTLQKLTSVLEAFQKPNSGQSSQRSVQGERCFNCGGQGHYSRECPSRRSDSPVRPFNLPASPKANHSNRQGSPSRFNQPPQPLPDGQIRPLLPRPIIN